MEKPPTPTPQADPTVALLKEFAGGFSPIVEHNGNPFLLRHKDYAVEELEKLLPQPQRKRGTTTLTDPDSFIEFVKNQKQANTLIFATDRTVTAVLNFHGTDVEDPQWGDYRAVLVLTATEEWSRWMRSNKEKFGQVEFAQFLETNELLFQDPNGADLLELVTTLEGKSKVRFNSGIRLQSGQNKLDYEEEVSLVGGGGTQKGQLEIPARLRLGIAPYEGVSKYEVHARLRYRIEQQKLIFWYETIDPHVIIKDAIGGILEKIEQGTEIKPLLGTA